MKRLLSFVIVMAVLCGAGFAAYRLSGKFNWGGAPDLANREIPRAKVQLSDVVGLVEAIGQIRARESSIISSPFSGRLRRLIPEGTYVREGEVVAEMETQEFEDELEQQLVDLKLRTSEYQQRVSELELQRTQNDLALESEEAKAEFARLALTDARRKFDEQRKLLERNLISQSALEAERLSLLQAELNAKEAEISLRKLKENHGNELLKRQTEIDKAKVNVEKVEKRVEDRRRNLEEAQMRATREGFVSYLYTWRGRRAKIAEGDQVWERNGIIEIPDSRQMQVAIPVNELDITRVAEGQQVRVSVAAIPGEVFAGKVSRKTSVPLTSSNNPFGETREGVKQFEVFIAFDAQDDRFRQNMTATATIEVARAERVLAVPVDAVFVTEADPPRRYLLVENGAAIEELDIELGVVGDNLVEAKPLSGGKLQEGLGVLLRDPRAQ